MSHCVFCYDHVFAKSTLHYSLEAVVYPRSWTVARNESLSRVKSEGEGRTNLTNWEGEQPAALGQGNVWAPNEIAFPLLKCSVTYNDRRTEVIRQ